MEIFPLKDPKNVDIIQKYYCPSAEITENDIVFQNGSINDLYFSYTRN